MTLDQPDLNNNFAILELAGGYLSLVDSEDFDRVKNFSWCPIKQGNGQVRVMTKIKGETVYLHRLVLKYEGPLVIDHINGHSLDNRKSNLRICQTKQNSYNARKPISNTSGYKGVTRHGKKWRAYIAVDYKQISLGCFISKEEAAEAYNKAAIKYFGQFAKLNKVGGI